MLFKKPAETKAIKNWTQEDDLYLIEQANQALMDKQAALKKKNQLWWEQMWKQIRISLGLGIVTTPFMVTALISLKYHLDVLEHVPTSMLTDCILPEKNIPTNDVPENSSVWNFKPTTNGIMGIALASCIVCAVPIYIITKHFLY